MTQVVLPHTFWMGVVAKTAATHEDGKIVWPLGLFIPAANFANICKEDSHHDHTSLPVVGAIIYLVVSNASRAGTPGFLAHCFPDPLDKQSSCSQLPLSPSPLLFQPLHQWLLIPFSTVLHNSCTAYTTLQWMKSHCTPLPSPASTGHPATTVPDRSAAEGGADQGMAAKSDSSKKASSTLARSTCWQ